MKTLNSIKNHLLLLGISIVGFNSFSQSVGCANSDFEQGNFTNWTGQTGDCCPILTPTNGLVTAPNNSAPSNGRHVIMTGTGNDPNTCNVVPRVAPGSTFSARLGNSSIGSQSEKLRYQFNITAETSLIIYKYAVILEDPGHPVADQPRFEARLKDQNGTDIPCTYYLVVAGTGTSSFSTCNSSGTKYKNWQTIGVDATAYIGQTVTLEFSTGDCGQGQHYGYAYVDAGCAPFFIDSRYCVNSNGFQSAFLTAPAGFASYQWSTGQTGNTALVLNPTNGQVVTCQITSVNGCVATLSSILTPSILNTDFTPVNACAGQPVNMTSSSTILNGTLQSYLWSSSDGYTSNTNNFSHTYSTPGNYTIKLTNQTDLGCKDSISKTITIHAIPNALENIPNNCVGDEAILTASSSSSDNAALTHEWLINQVDTLIGNNLPISFPISDTVNLQLISTSEFGCKDTTNGQFFIYDNPNADFTFVEQCIDQPVFFTNTSTATTLNTSFQWIVDNILYSTSTDTNSYLSNPGNNEVSLIAFENHGNITCDDTITKIIVAHDLPVISFDYDSTICEDISFEIFNNSTVSTGENLTYTWYQNGNIISTDSTLTYTLNNEGVYPITMTALSSFGCQSTEALNMYIYPTPPPPVLATTVPFCPGDSITFSSVAEPNSVIFWNGPNNFNSTQSTFSMPFEISQLGTYSAFIASQYGCISEPSTVGTAIQNVYGFDDFIMPNVITANDDGINDVLDLQSYFQSCDKYKIYILNRWGHVVFEQDENSSQFIGDNKNGEELVEGVYFYKLEYESPLDKGVKSGFIHVVK
ncbi:MAG: PKD domain-containing protein [Crocinitomicaceae bacterium]|nr:PKD domain-containing protein [Crocinitomicaceae bacterium]